MSVHQPVYWQVSCNPWVRQRNLKELEERGWTVLQDPLDDAAVLNAREAALVLVRRASYSGQAGVCCSV